MNEHFLRATTMRIGQIFSKFHFTSDFELKTEFKINLFKNNSKKMFCLFFQKKISRYL